MAVDFLLFFSLHRPSADAARVPGRPVRQPDVVPSGCGRGVRLHQPPPRLEAPPGQRLHHTHPLHRHEGGPARR